MGLQLIFCVETNKKTQSDVIYIKQTISQFYNLNNAHQKLSWVFMDGKGKYASASVRKDIEKRIKAYKVSAEKNESIVIYCFDCDDYDVKQEDADFLQKARSYCQDNAYRFVWFCKDIEQVFLGKRVPDGMKGKEARAFAVKGRIDKEKIRYLKQKNYQNGYSNLALVLNDYLEMRE